MSAALSCRPCSPGQRSKAGRAATDTDTALGRLSMRPGARQEQDIREEGEGALTTCHTLTADTPGFRRENLRGRESVALVIKGTEWPGTHHVCRGRWSGRGWTCFLGKVCPQRPICQDSVS